MPRDAADTLTLKAPMSLPDGLYDQVPTEDLTRSLSTLDPGSADVSAVKRSAAEFLTDVKTRQLASIPDDVSGNEAEKVKRQLELVNASLVMLRQKLGCDGA